MPVTPTYPGVYIEEIPSGVRTIVGVPTSIAAFIDFFRRGPINRAVQIFNMGDFEREFGGLDTRSEASYAIQQFFLNGGTEAWVIRTAADDPLTPAITDPQAASLVLQDGSGGNVLRVTAGRRMQGVAVDDPGIWGNNLRIDIDYDTTDPATLFNLTVSELGDRNGRPVTLQREAYRNLQVTDSSGVSNSALEVVNEGSKLIQLSRDAGWPESPPAQTGTTANGSPNLAGIVDGNEFRINNNVNWTATLRVDSVPTTIQEARTILEAAIRAIDPNLPLLAGATVQVIGDRLRVLGGGRTSNTFDPELILEFTDHSGTPATAFGLETSLAGVSNNVQQYSVGSGTAGTGAQGAVVEGTDGNPPGATELRGIRDPDKSGLYALEDVDIFNILCIPRAADLSSDSEMAAVISEATAYCEERFAFLIVDIPARIDTVQEVKDWLDQNATLRHPNTALYFPRPRIPDPLNNFRLRSVGASGTMAGLYARTDVERGVWKAPAGTEASLRNVQELDYTLTDPENGTLNPLGINCLRTFPIYGNISWGARTLMGADVQASEWKYVPVRRITLFLEQSLLRGTQWAVFEPNDEPLWAQLRLNIGAFMQNLFRQGAFQGRSPREAYLVKCDRETTTQNDINLGIVNVIVGFAPLKPAEFVILKIQQLAGQVQT